MEEKIIQVMRDVFETDNLSVSTSQYNCEKWNSLKHLSLVSELEEAFDVEFEPEEIADMTSVNNIIDIIKKKL